MSKGRTIGPKPTDRMARRSARLAERFADRGPRQPKTRALKAEDFDVEVESIKAWAESKAPNAAIEEMAQLARTWIFDVASGSNSDFLSALKMYRFGKRAIPGGELAAFLMKLPPLDDVMEDLCG